MNEEMKDLEQKIELKIEQTAEEAKGPDLKAEDLEQVVGGIVYPKFERRPR